ncbi:T9SS type A sorting domain-containing protein [candidate division KSB1 bacterium]|nr:T9SS type A sorting domain-containing protein [candidate division KSB1 bacterium]
MRKIATLLFVVTLMLLLSVSLFAQTAGDYRTRASGDWSMAQNWEIYSGSAWRAIGSTPTGTETITIQSTDSIFVNIAVSITGTLVNQGIVEANEMLAISNGGTYQHDRDAGKVPLATWEEGSDMLITGVTSTAPEDRDQDYYSLTFNTPGLLSNLNMNLNCNTISGDVRVINTGYARWYLTTALATDTSIVTVMGDIIVEDGMFSVQGTSNAQTTFIVHHYGNIEVTGGNFSISRGSQGGGTTTWYLYEGNFSMSNATTQSSTATPGGAKFVFMKQGAQTLTLGEGNTLTALPIEVSSGATLDMGASQLSGNGIFIVTEGATVMTTLAGGVADIVSGIAAEVTLQDGSSYGFNGTSAQVTSGNMPITVTDLIINNPAGVALSLQTTINGVLRLKAGEFDNTVPFTLGPNGTISYEGGSLKLPVSVELQKSNAPEAFFVEQNYPNPFNPSTTIKFGLPFASHVTVKVFNILGYEVATLLDRREDAGLHRLSFDASNLSAGIYFYQIQAGKFVEFKRMVLLK